MAAAELISGKSMTKKLTFIRRDSLTLLIYLVLVALVQIVEVKFKMPGLAKAIYLATSTAYLVAVVLIHRTRLASEANSAPRMVYGGICAAFAIVGPVVGIIVGVNAKFMLGGTL